MRPTKTGEKGTRSNAKKTNAKVTAAASIAGLVQRAVTNAQKKMERDRRNRKARRAGHRIPQYEDRLCLFLDFLGFKAMVEESVDDERRRDAISFAISAVRDQFAPLRDFNNRRLPTTKVVTQFSDSIAVSYRVKDASSAYDLVSDTLFCLVRLAELGFLIRGGLARGPLFHTASHLFGPAMISAYELENKAAVYPRVIVQEGLIDAAEIAPALHHDSVTESKYVKQLLTRDFDGLLYIDYISWNSVINQMGGDQTIYPTYLETIANLVSNNIASQDFGIRAKYGWVARHYMETVTMIAKTPRRSPFRKENPGVVERIDRLPRFDVPGSVR